jgi:hypothetical protein
MVGRLVGKEAMSALQLSRESGIAQQLLSRWLRDARSLPLMTSKSVKGLSWTVEQKARFLAEASRLGPEQLHAYLEREGVKAVEFERWRVALQEDGSDSNATSKRIRKLQPVLGFQFASLISTMKARALNPPIFSVV